MGGDLGGLGGRSPQNLRWGTAMYPAPNIWRSYRMSVKVRSEKKRCDEGIFSSEIEVFPARKGRYMVYISKYITKPSKNRENTVDEKRSSEIFGVKIEIFS